MVKHKVVKVLIGFCFLIALSSCGKKDVIYNEDTVSEAASTDTGAESMEYNPDAENPIADMVGVTDSYKWKEDIPLNNGGSVKVDAELYYTDWSKPVVASVSRHSLDAGDKKEIAEYLFDRDSIKLDMDSYPTKETIEKKLENIYELRTMVEEEMSAHTINGDYYLTLLENEEGYLLDKLNTAPEAYEVSTAVADYSENYYTGTCNGIEGSLVFEEDSDGIISGFTYEVKNYNDMVKTDYDISYIIPAYEDMRENQCTMSRDDLYAYTDEIVKGLGLQNIKRAWSAMDLVWCLSNGDVCFDGYRVTYDISFNDDICYYNNVNIVEDYGCINSSAPTPSYQDMEVELWVNDSGIIKLTLNGNAQIQKVSETKLLGYEEIKQCLREIISGKSDLNGVEYRAFNYCYVRIIDETTEGSYVYLPVWVLDDYQNYAIVINAIDGSEIDKERDIAHIYTTFDEWEDEYRSWYLYRHGYDGNVIANP